MVGPFSYKLFKIHPGSAFVSFVHCNSIKCYASFLLMKNHWDAIGIRVVKSMQWSALAGLSTTSCAQCTRSATSQRITFILYHNWIDAKMHIAHCAHIVCVHCAPAPYTAYTKSQQNRQRNIAREREVHGFFPFFKMKIEFSMCTTNINYIYQSHIKMGNKNIANKR